MVAAASCTTAYEAMSARARWMARRDLGAYCQIAKIPPERFMPYTPAHPSRCVGLAISMVYAGRVLIVPFTRVLGVM
jgi:hypothetical protein